MKRSILVGLICLMSVTAHAGPGDLERGIKAWEQRDFATAVTVLTPLANGGNAEAQLLLGEMAGYGEGLPEDLTVAERWLKQAKAGGNKDADESLATIRQRATRKDEIARYMVTAATVPTLSSFGCAMPAFPEFSATQVEIKAVSAKAGEWRDCYGRYGASLGSLSATAPADLAKLMNMSELEQVRQTRQQALAAATTAANNDAAAFGKAYEVWFAKTKQHSDSMDKVTRDESNRRQREIEDVTMRARQAMDAAKAGK